MNAITPLAQIRETLRAAFQAHRVGFGVPPPVRTTSGAVVLRWRDYMTCECGILGRVPVAESDNAIAVVLEDLRTLRAELKKPNRPLLRAKGATA